MPPRDEWPYQESEKLLSKLSGPYLVRSSANKMRAGLETERGRMNSNELCEGAFSRTGAKNALTLIKKRYRQIPINLSLRPSAESPCSGPRCANYAPRTESPACTTVIALDMKVGLLAARASEIGTVC